MKNIGTTALFVLIAVSIFAQNDGHCLIQEEAYVNFNASWNKTIATLLKAEDKEYFGHHAIYKNKDYGKDVYGNIIARCSFVDVALKRKKDGLCKLVQYIIVEKNEGGSSYSEPYLNGEIFRADGMDNIIQAGEPNGLGKNSLLKPWQPCSCIEKTTNWLEGGNGSSQNSEESNAKDKPSANSNKKQNVYVSNEKAKNGPEQEFDSNGKIAREGEYKNGKKAGLWKEYDSEGNITTKEYFTDGNRDSSFSYSNKVLRSVRRYNGTQKHGKQEEYRSNGKLQTLETYNSGKLDGKYGEYKEDGSVYTEGNYKQGKKQGKWLRENGSGYLTEGNYVDGQQDGEWTVKDRKTGKLIRVEKYEMGDLKN